MNCDTNEAGRIEGGRGQDAGRASFRNAICGAAWLSGYQLMLNVVSVPALAYIIRELGSVTYAHWMTATGLLTFATLATNMGLRPAFVRRVAEGGTGVREALAEQLGLRLVLSAAAAACVVMVCWALGYPSIVLWCAVVGGIGLLLTTIATTFADVLQATQRVRALARTALVSGLCLTLGSVAAAWTGASHTPCMRAGPPPQVSGAGLRVARPIARAAPATQSSASASHGCFEPTASRSTRGPR